MLLSRPEPSPVKTEAGQISLDDGNIDVSDGQVKDPEYVLDGWEVPAGSGGLAKLVVQ